MKSVLVTGGAGFVGARLAIALREAKSGLRVVALDNLRRRGSELNLPRLRAAGVDFLHGDIRCAEDLEAAGSADLILECSAEPSVLAGYGESPRYVLETNLSGTLNCLEAARRYKAAILFLSTSRVYPIETIRQLRYRETDTRFELEPDQETPGVSPRGFSEAFPLEGERSIYGATKFCSELVLNEYRAMYDLPAVINRCGVITGPWQMGKVDQGVVVLWVARHLFGGALNYIGFGGTGKQVRDILHIDDLAQLVLYQIDHMAELSGKTFNVGGGREVSVSLCELTALCRKITGKTIPVGRESNDRPADIPLYLSDYNRVARATGWRPQHTVQQIIEDITRWITSNRTMLEAILR